MSSSAYGDSSTGYGYDGAGGHPGQPVPAQHQSGPTGGFPYGSGASGATGGSGPGSGSGSTAVGSPTSGGSGGKFALFGCIGCGVLVLLAALAVVLALILWPSGSDTGGGGGGTTGTGGTTPPVSTTNHGTRAEPLDAGTPVTLEMDNGDLTVTLGEVNWDAEDEVMEGSEYNPEAGDGEVYVTVPVTLQLEGEGPVSPSMAAKIDYIDAGGNTHTETYVSGIPGTYDVGDLYGNASGEYTVVFLMPEDAAQDGVFRVEEWVNFDSEPYYLAG